MTIVTRTAAIATATVSMGMPAKKLRTRRHQPPGTGSFEVRASTWLWKSAGASTGPTLRTNSTVANRRSYSWRSWGFSRSARSISAISGEDNSPSM